MPNMITNICLALRILTHQKGRLILSVLGISFSVVIMFMEIGFFNGINDSQGRLWPLLNADLVMMEKKRYSVIVAKRFQRLRLQQALTYNEVTEVIPIYEETGLIFNPEDSRLRSIHMLAFPPDAKRPLAIPGLEQYMDPLRVKGNIVYDSMSRDVYGRISQGTQITLNDRPHTVLGSVKIGPHVYIDGYVIMGDVSMEGRNVDKIDLGLIRAKPGTDIQALKEKLTKGLSKDVIIMTPEEARVREVVFTTGNAPTGALFSAGVTIGFLIGVILCYQILYNEITDHLPQYATLKALGFSRQFMIALMIKKALILSVLGYLLGLAGGYLLYTMLEHYTHILMLLTINRCMLIMFLTVVMCVVGGFLAVQKVLKADPAELY